MNKNKLISSKNSILRFKEGKDFPERFKGEKYLYNDIFTLGNVLRAFNFTTNPVKTTIEATAPVIYKNLSLEEPKKIRYKGKVYSTYKGKVYNLDKYGKPISEATGFNLTRDINENLRNTVQKTPAVQNKYGTKEELLAKLKKYGSVSSVINNFKNKKSDISNPVKSVTRKPYFQSKYANRANEINPNDIIKLQKKLGVKADGIWGDKTETAYLASKAFNSPEAINITKKSDIPPVQTPTSDIGTFAYNPTLVTTIPTLTYSVQPGYSVAYNAIKDNINTRYASTFMKKGGQLPSRNIIERFKQGGILKFLNAGNLPTAPKAEDRYKDSYKSWNWPLFKEVTAGSILFPGAKISLAIEGSDTTYMETPPRFPFVKVVPRVAKNNAKTIEWRDLITGLTYPEVKRGNSREYEILKRRFNTAWNLAK